jgi:protease-4
MGKTRSEPTAKIKEQLGAEQYQVYKQMIEIKQMCNTPQARLPFQFVIR